MTDVIARVLEALNARDLDAFVACYAPDATIEDGYDRIAARGHDELRARYGPMFDALHDLRVECVSRTEIGEFVVQEELITRRGAAERHVAVYLVRDDLIARERLVA